MSDEVQQAELLKAFRINLRARRNELGLTQQEVAERANLPQPHVSALERGSIKPMVATLAPLADALDTTPSALLSVAAANESEKILAKSA